MWKNSYLDIYNYFNDYQIQLPTLVFNGCILDKNTPEEIPLSPVYHGNRYYKLPGCYAFIERKSDLFPESHVEIMYIGKAVNLRSRLITHWNNFSASSFLQKWVEWADTEYKGCRLDPFVCCWLTEESERAHLESVLINVLKPKFNQRKE